jgi:serine/threonine protein phosphatase PrpC
MITRWLGPPDSDDPGIETFRVTLDPGDSVLCCTDGLYMYFSPPAGSTDEISSVLRQDGLDLQTGLDRLVELAVRRGGHDNITAAAIQTRADRPDAVTVSLKSTEKTVSIRMDTEDAAGDPEHD